MSTSTKPPTNLADLVAHLDAHPRVSITLADGPPREALFSVCLRGGELWFTGQTCPILISLDPADPAGVRYRPDGFAVRDCRVTYLEDLRP